MKEQIPPLYDAYVRIFHPLRDASGQSVTWAQVACRLGQEAHRQMQWHALVGSSGPASLAGSRWLGSRPALGELPAKQFKTLSAILKQHTDSPLDCYFGLSTIHAEIDPAPAGHQLLRLLNREFVVYSGPLREAASESLAVAPNMIWPSDNRWLVASEYDFDSTLVGGSEDLIRALDDSPGLETWMVYPQDCLAEDADTRNVAPPPAR